MSASRSALEYMQRKGLVRAEFAPRPRLSIRDLLINQIPVPNEQTSQGVLEAAEGTPSPDRGAAQPWPNQT